MPVSRLQMVPSLIQRLLRRGLLGFCPANPLARKERREERPDPTRPSGVQQAELSPAEWTVTSTNGIWGYREDAEEKLLAGKAHPCFEAGGSQR